MKNKLPAALFATGLFILVFALIKLYQASAGLTEHSPLPPALSDWRYEMDSHAANGRGHRGNIVLPERWSP